MNLLTLRFTWWYRLWLRLRFRIRGGSGLSDWRPVKAGDAPVDKCEFTPKTIHYSSWMKPITKEEKQ